MFTCCPGERRRFPTSCICRFAAMAGWLGLDMGRMAGLFTEGGGFCFDIICKQGCILDTLKTRFSMGSTGLAG